MASDNNARHVHVGAEIIPSGGVHFRVWAPSCARVAVVIEGTSPGAPLTSIPLDAEKEGFFSKLVPGSGAGTLYRYRLDDQQELYPDPASRFQPFGPAGLSQVVDPGSFSWTDHEWRGITSQNQVLYEMHIGTFTKEGTWVAAVPQLKKLKEIGITVLEMMPIAEFPGRFGWGYDGVNLFAPSHLYGTPGDLRRFIDTAHATGLGVILDVVYNHFGPDQSFIGQFSKDYFTQRYTTDWGDAINFDGGNSGPVRQFFKDNACYWIDEFHFDGLRFDATQNVYDASEMHILMEVVSEAQKKVKGRALYFIAENEPQITKLIKSPEQGGYGLDALWNDDFHHTALVRLTGQREAYYTDYLGTPQEFVSAAKYAFLYQGQRYAWQSKRRGTPTFGLAPSHFIHFLQNHDQVANSPRGLRLQFLTNPGNYRALTALLLLAPQTPLLFQGQEFAASAPFLYFADLDANLMKLVEKGRKVFLKQFRRLALPEIQKILPVPNDADTFERSKLDLSERDRHQEAYALHCDLLRLRQTDPVFNKQRSVSVDGAVLSHDAFILRFFGGLHSDRIVLVNLGIDIRLDPAPEPLLAPPEDALWELLWSSEHPRYGGNGTPPLETKENWKIPGESLVVLVAKSKTELQDIRIE